MIVRTGNVAGVLIYGLNLAAITWRCAGVNQLRDIGDLVQGNQAIAARHTSESTCPRPLFTAGDRARAIDPGLPTPIEHRDRSVPHITQHPPQARGDHATAIVIGHHALAGRDAQGAKQCAQLGRCGQGMATLIGHRWPTQMPLEMGITSARDVRLKIGQITSLRRLQIETTIDQHQFISLDQSGKFGHLHKRRCRDVIHQYFRDYTGPTALVSRPPSATPNLGYSNLRTACSRAPVCDVTLPRPRRAAPDRCDDPKTPMRASLSPNIISVQRATTWRLWAAMFGLLLVLTLSGCASLDYYLQAVDGQFQIWQRQRSIDALLAQHDLPAPLRAKLELVVRARRFAAAHLALPDHGSYRHYADVGRDYVVWNVFAAPELALTPYPSCYPLLGCLDYRGFFSQARARLHAATLDARGYDTFVGGVAAYSTLGWLNDPLLNTVLRWDERRVVDTIFHELAHQQLYLAGDTTFNESFAMTVAQAGMALWLGEKPTAHQRYLVEQAREATFIALVQEYRKRLAIAYAAPQPDAQKRMEKARLYDELRARYAELKAAWGGDSAYDAWMNTDLNNAKLASLAAYHDDVAAFAGVLARCEHDFRRFYRVIERLAGLAGPARRACLAQLGRAERLDAPCAALMH